MVEFPQELREYFAKHGKKGGKKRAANLTAARRKEIAEKAAAKRWGKPRKKDKP
jgi:hypothetical protein